MVLRRVPSVEAEATLSEQILVETLQPGDLVELPVLGAHVVSSVSVEPDEEVRIVYFRTVETGWSTRGIVEREIIVERGLRPFRPGDTIAATRGHPATAAELRARMLIDRERRHTEIAERYARDVRVVTDPEPAL
jgi:hypothetical protein